LLCQNLLKMNAQVMATGINEKELEASWNECQAEVFHVKQGVLSALSSTRE
jgi:recombinational DNA repair ATPase RecF